jgi:hypothetical protein
VNSLTICYTQNIGGDLALLPRLYRYLQELKQKYDPNALLLDLGNSCSPDVWHCEVTKGRSTLTVMDAMGYHAANAMALDDNSREILKSSVSMGLVTERQAWRYHVPPLHDDDILVAGQESPALKLCIVAVPAQANKLENRMLHLKSVNKGIVGIVTVDMEAMRIKESLISPMPEETLPEPTIIAAVELVEEEARYAQRKKG